jgi:hypothetical protein
MIRLVSRSVTSAEPSGRKAIAHGTWRPDAITLATTLGGPGSTGVPSWLVGGGSFGGPLVVLLSGGPNEQPASSANAASTAVARIVLLRAEAGGVRDTPEA